MAKEPSVARFGTLEVPDHDPHQVGYVLGVEPTRETRPSSENHSAANIAEFQRTGFHGALNYYRTVQPYFDLSGAYRGAKIAQPAYFMWGKSDGLFPIYQLTEAKLRDRLPGLAGYVGLDGVGHWVQHEAADHVSEQLVTFARSVSHP